MENTTTLLHAEDLSVGMSFELDTVTVDADEIVAFATEFDPLPLHIDAADSPFGTVIASSIHTMALFASVASPGYVGRLALVAGKGIDRLRLPHPVRPGSILQPTVRITDIRHRADRADVYAHCQMTDQDNLVVLDMHSITVVRARGRRVAAAPPRYPFQEDS